MEWKEYERKKRFRRVITNTFSSNEDCEMFIMVLKQQWPKHINKLPNSELEITRSVENGNIMSAIWTLSDIKHFEILEKIGNETGDDLETFMKKKEKYTSSKIKSLLFEKCFMKIHNQQNGIRTIFECF